MVDFRKFLREKDEEVSALYLGGIVAHARGRTLRLKEPLAAVPGTYVFRVKGRNAELVGPSADAFDLSDLPREVGHFVGGWLVPSEGHSRTATTLELLGNPEPEVLAPVRARRHPTGAMLFDEALFEGEVESEARGRLDAGSGLAGMKGVVPSLRTAFAFATALAAARRRGVVVSPGEIRREAMRIADEGAPAADGLVATIVARREAERAVAEERARRDAVRAIAGSVARRSAAIQASEALDPTERADRALTKAGARMLGTRAMGNGQLEVRFEYLGERIISVVDENTLHVYDSGVCLAGADEEVTLESLPSVIREAVDDGVLVITRH